MSSEKKTCASCRYAATYKRPKVLEETGFGDQLMFADADEDETVYICRAWKSLDFQHDVRASPVGLCEYAGQEIGLIPVTCGAWAESEAHERSQRLAVIDAQIAAWEARAARREQE